MYLLSDITQDVDKVTRPIDKGSAFSCVTRGLLAVTKINKPK